MKKFIYNLFAKRHFKKSLQTLRQLENKLGTPRSRLAIPFLFRGKGHFKTMRCMQNPYEIESLFHMVHELQPKTVLEIGTAKGGALYLWAQAAHPEALVMSVDLPDGEFGGGYHESRIPFYKSFARPQQQLHLVRDDSHAAHTLEHVKRILGDRPLDFLFIDGDHTYKGVKQDFELYGPLVRKGGIIGFHDILPRPDLPDIQVDRFWNEIRSKYDSVELIGPDGPERKFGSGIIRVR